MIRRLLCLLGFHLWRPKSMPTRQWKCKYCFAERETVRFAKQDDLGGRYFLRSYPY